MQIGHSSTSEKLGMKIRFSHVFPLNRELFLGGPAEYNSQMQINLLVNPNPQNPKSFEPLSVRIESQRGCLLLTQHLTCSWLVGGAEKTGEGNSEILMSVTVPGVCLFYDRLLWSSYICERFQPPFGYLALSVCRFFLVNVSHLFSTSR